MLKLNHIYWPFSKQSIRQEADKKAILTETQIKVRVLCYSSAYCGHKEANKSAKWIRKLKFSKRVLLHRG